MSLISKSFGRRLRKARKVKFKTARIFADILAIEENTLTRWERGETEPSFEMLMRICQVLDTTPNALLLGPHHTDEPLYVDPLPSASKSAPDESHKK